MPSPRTETPRPSVRISARGDAWTRRIAVVGTFVVAIAAAILSFQALAELAIEQGYDPALAYLFPVAVDGMMLTSAMVTTHGALRGVRLHWAYAATALGAGLSVYGNVVHSWNGTVTSVIVHAVPPLFMLIGIEMALYLTRMRMDERAVEAEVEAKEAEREARRIERAQARAAKAQQASVQNPIQEPQNQPQERVEAPSAPRVQASAPKRSQGGSVKVNQARVEAVKAVMETAEYKALDARNGKFNPALASLLMNSVEGVTPLEARRAGVLLIDGMTPDAHRMQVARSFSNAKKKAKVEVASDADQEDAEPSVRRLAAV